MHIDEDMTNLISFLEIFANEVPGQSSQIKSYFQQSVDPLRLSCTNMFMNNVLSIYLLCQK